MHYTLYKARREEMKIVFTADDAKGIESVVSYHFGHCPYFIIVNLDDNNVIKKVESIENPYSEEHNPGELPEFINTIGADMIVTGGMGPKAQEFFKQYGIKPIVGAYGKVKDVLKEILGGNLHYDTQNPPPHEHGEHHREGEDEEIRRLKIEIQDLRKQIALLKSVVLELKEKMEQ